MHSKGFSTVEALVALTVFLVGVLGAAGTMMVALRAERAGRSAAAAAQLTIRVVDSISAWFVRPASPCLGARSGSTVTADSIALRWEFAPAPGGQSLRLSLRYPGFVAEKAQTLFSHVPCL